MHSSLVPKCHPTKWQIHSPPFPESQYFWWIRIEEHIGRGITGKFFWEGKVIFPVVKCFFPLENFHFGRPKRNFSGFEKWQAKKKTTTENNNKQTNNKKKKVLSSFCNFSIKFFLLQFSFFSSQFSPLFPFFLACFFPVGQQKFPSQKSLMGGTLPPAPVPVTPLHIV